MNICKPPPTLNDFAIPAPPETTRPPVVVDVELSVELNVALPVAAPIDITVAAPKALIFVAVALNKLNVAEFVVTLVVKSGDVAKTNAPLPVSSDIRFFSCNELVCAKTLKSLPVVVKVPATGKVTFVVAVVVKVSEFAPEVISEEPLARVKVALVAGAVKVSLLYVDAETFPFAKITPDTEDVEPAEVYKLPPIPTPPVTTKAPLFEAIEVWLEVIFTVPPMKAFDATPNPPADTSAPVEVEDELVV